MPFLYKSQEKGSVNGGCCMTHMDWFLKAGRGLGQWALAGLLLLHVSWGWAQEALGLPSAVSGVSAATVSFRQLGTVEITGSSIVRKEQTQALPVQVVTRSDIEKSGKQDLAAFLQSLPLLFNGFNPAMLGMLRSGFSGGAVHGLQTGTLVLINGHRLANYGLQSTAGSDNGGVDLNALPLSAVERVEILTDGASSVYGTDAQSGV